MKRQVTRLIPAGSTFARVHVYPVGFIGHVWSHIQ